MSSEKFDTLNTLIQLTMVLKLQQLKRNGLPSLRYSNLEEYINEKLWVNQLPQSLHLSPGHPEMHRPPGYSRVHRVRSIGRGADHGRRGGHGSDRPGRRGRPLKHPRRRFLLIIHQEEILHERENL